VARRKAGCFRETPPSPPAPGPAPTFGRALYLMPAPAAVGPRSMARAAAAPAQAAMAGLLLASARLGSARRPAPPLRAPGRCGKAETLRGFPDAPVSGCCSRGGESRARKAVPKSPASSEGTLWPGASLWETKPEKAVFDQRQPPAGSWRARQHSRTQRFLGQSFMYPRSCPFSGDNNSHGTKPRCEEGTSAPGTSLLSPKTPGMLRGCQRKIFPFSQPATCSQLGCSA